MVSSNRSDVTEALLYQMIGKLYVGLQQTIIQRDQAIQIAAAKVRELEALKAQPTPQDDQTGGS